MPLERLFAELTFKDDLIPAVIADAHGRVLTLCYMNREAVEKTVRTGMVHVFRRSKGRLMLKGETSGHTQTVKDLRADCEGRSLLITVEQKVAACHLGYMSCFHRRYRPRDDDFEVEGERLFDPEDAYGS
jgi:phosphoribosyl-AMP cyclohydrolase